MGQQQLLLVILVTILVGIATVVAINTFGTAADNANVDAVRTDALQIASAAQGYYMKPAMMGGGGQSFANIEFNDIGFPANVISNGGLTAVNENGTYVIGSRGTGSFTLTAYPSGDPDYAGDASTANTAGGSMVYTVEPDSAYISTAYTPGASS